MQKHSRVTAITTILYLALWLVCCGSSVVSGAQTFIHPTSPSGAVPITCTGSATDATTIQAAMNSSPGVILSGVCNLAATTLTFGSNFFLGGTATLNYTGTGWAVASSGNYNTVTGLTFNGGGLNLSLNDTTNYTGQYGWTIEGNTFQNISNGNQAAVYVTNIIGKGPSETAPDTTSISYNTFYNIWGPRAYPDLNTDAWGGSAGCGTDCMVGSSGIFINFGWDNVKVDYNEFDTIGGNAIKGGNDHLLGYIDPYMGQNIDVSHNVMARVHRIGIEVQGSMSGACPGGCNYNAHYMDGVITSANYFHAPALAMDTFAYSLMFGATNVQILNNSAVDEDPNNVWPLGIGLENAFNGGLLQGNVISSVYVVNAGGYNNGHSWAGGPIDTGYTATGYTDMFYNNYGCGDGYAPPSLIGYDPDAAATVDEKAEYVAGSCPANIATSNIVPAFTGSTDPTPTATSWTFQLGVTSTLSVAQVQFFLDGSKTPIATQEIQDFNPDFSTTPRWLYHVDVDLSKLSGSHTLTATATDVSGGTQSATQSFNVPGTGTAAGPIAPVVTPTPGDGQITLSWSAAAGATYSVYRGTSPGAEGSMPIVSGVTGTTYTDTYLTNGITYYYTVSASNPGVGMAISAEVSAAPNGPPIVPLVLDSPTVSNGTVVLAWNSLDDNATYSVYRGTKPGGEALSPIVSGLTSATYADTTVVNGMTYFYRVSANIRFDVVGGMSNEVSASPKGTGEGLSMNLAVATGDSQATLTWNNVLAGATYSIYRGTAPGGEDSTPIMAVYGVTGYLDTGLINGTTYYYTVSTVVPGIGGGFANSTEVSVTPAAPVARSGGVLTGSINTASTTYNLTTLGTSDWASWGLWDAGGNWGGNLSSFNHKTGGWSQISDAGLAGNGEGNIGYWDDSTIPIQVSWTNGAPISSPVNSGGVSYGYYYATGGVPGSGFFFSAPADTTPRTLMFIAGACANGITDIVAHISDNSAPDYTDRSLVNTAGGCPGQMGAYTLTYKAASAGQTLTVYVTADQNQPGETWLTAAALQGGTPQVTATINVASKLYDGTAAATITGCTLNGVSVGADVQCNYSSVTASFADANVGTGKKVVVTGSAALTGTEAAGYALVSTSSGTANITAIPLNLHLASTHLVYPGATNVTACIPSTGAASPTGTIQIYDGNTLLTTQPVQGGGCAYWYISPGLSAGTHQLSAIYSGDKKNPADSSAPVSVEVDPVSVNLSAACWNPSFNYGANYQCTVSASSNAGSAKGAITYSYDGGAAVAVPLNNGNAQFSILLPAVGSHSVAIGYAQQGNYGTASAPVESFAVIPAPVYVALTPSSWYVTAGTTLTFKAAVTSYSAGAPKSNGAVSFSDASTPLITIPVDGSGQASFSTSNLSKGSHTITATYSSGIDYATGSSSVTITVAP